jgi:hypothetical protein
MDGPWLLAVEPDLIVSASNAGLDGNDGEYARAADLLRILDKPRQLKERPLEVL